MPAVSLKCWESLPGVPTKIFISSISSFSNLTSFPPVTNPAEKEMCLPILVKTSKICTANSSVGETINATKPSSSVIWFRYNDSMVGIKNAKVLPDPVSAVAMMSWPFNAYGMDFFWMSVQETKLPSFKPFKVSCEMGRSSKSESFCTSDSENSSILLLSSAISSSSCFLFKTRRALLDLAFCFLAI